MDSLTKKSSGKKAELIGSLELAGNTYTIAADGNLALGLINGYRVVDANLYENPVDEIIPVLASIITKDFREHWYEGLKITFNKKDWDSEGKYPSEVFKDKLVRELSLTLGENCLAFKEGQDTEETDLFPKKELRVPKEFTDISKALINYGNQIQKVLLSTERMLEESEALLRVKFVDSMWGVSEIQKVLQPLRANGSNILEELFFSLGQKVSLANKAVGRLVYRMDPSRPLSKDDKKFISIVLIPDILKSFEDIRGIVTRVLKTVYPLYVLEENFKEATGNPLTWSIPGNIIHNFKESFTVLLDFLADVPVADVSVMTPIENVRSRFLNFSAV